MYGQLPATGGISPLRLVYLAVALCVIAFGLIIKMFR